MQLTLVNTWTTWNCKYGTKDIRMGMFARVIYLIMLCLSTDISLMFLMHKILIFYLNSDEKEERTDSVEICT